MNLICGYTEREINEEVARQLAECKNEKQRELLLEIAAEARANGHCWPLMPKPVPKPPLYIGHVVDQPPDK